MSFNLRRVSRSLAVLTLTGSLVGCSSLLVPERLGHQDTPLVGTVYADLNSGRYTVCERELQPFAGSTERPRTFLCHTLDAGHTLTVSPQP